MTIVGWLQAVVFFALVLVFVKPLGAYMARVFTGERTVLSPVLAPVEGLMYRLCRVRPEEEMSAPTYLLAMFAFSTAGLASLYLVTYAEVAAARSARVR